VAEVVVAAASAALLLVGSPAAVVAYSSRVQSLLAGMTLEEKVGQMLQLDLVGFLNPGTLELNRTRLESTMRDYHVGSILNSPFTLGPSGGKDGWTAADWKGIVRSIHEASLAQGEVPVLYGIDRCVDSIKRCAWKQCACIILPVVECREVFQSPKDDESWSIDGIRIGVLP